VEDGSNFTHDRSLRFAFAEPERMAELLTLFSRHNPTLKSFLDTIDLKTLRGTKENFSSDKHAGSADLVFEADIKQGGTASLRGYRRRAQVQRGQERDEANLGILPPSFCDASAQVAEYGQGKGLHQAGSFLFLLEVAL
jgi:hypothetical protein